MRELTSLDQGLAKWDDVSIDALKESGDVYPHDPVDRPATARVAGGLGDLRGQGRLVIERTDSGGIALLEPWTGCRARLVREQMAVHL